MAIVTSLRRARRNAGVSLRAVAAASGVGAPSLSNIENGRRDPSTSTVDRIANVIGVRFIPIVDNRRLSAADAVDLIEESTANGRFADAYRLFLQLADDLAASNAVERILLAAEEPRRTGSRWLDAIAALVEQRLGEAHAPLPTWVAANIGASDDVWEPRRTDRALPSFTDIADAPEPFRRRGIAIDAGELGSV
ncbi:MAG: helix-turn-helix domain-containing protein [Microbacterium sp.]|jgi:transcriptional regulator with XRE-family HTH domain|nr:helix-turn-helix domain-containing protein [Microbacterium sp.]